MMTVPDNMPFDQQVRLGEEAREAARRLIDPQPSRSTQGVTTTTTTVIRNGATVAGGMDKTTECQALSAHITSLEALSRQPDSVRTGSLPKSARHATGSFNCAAEVFG